ncbi:MAG TPA: hypothetical protein VGK41_00300 [Solirubrobacterales bacterium]
MRWGIRALMVLALLALPAGASAAAPANDNFANRQVLPAGFPGGEPVEVNASNVDATKEEGEFIPGLAPAGHSVWFVWEAASDGWVTIGACDNQFPTILMVFTGAAIGSLTPVANGNGSEGPDCPYQGRQYSFSAVSGTKYVIAVDGNFFPAPGSPPPVTEGEIELQIKETPVPPNDEFENAIEIAGQIFEEPGGDRTFFADTRGFNWTASIEHGEPQELTSGASVWYSLTAPEDGTYNFGAPCCQAAFQLVLDIYRGDAVNKLTPVVVGEQFPQVELAAGETVRIRVAGPNDEVTEQPAVAGFDFNVGAILPKPDTQTPNPFESWSQPSPPPDTAPETTIGKRFLAVGKARFWFSSSEPGGFLCRLDKGPFKPCSSPRAYKHLKSGRHTFKVKAVDAAGNVDPTPAVARFQSAARPR